MFTFSQEYIKYIDYLMQDCSISIAHTEESAVLH